MDEHEHVLDAIAQAFVTTGRWPDPVELDRELRSSGVRLHLVEVVTQMPRELGWRRWQPSEVQLSIFGLACSQIGRPLLAHYVDVLRLAVERYDAPSLPNRLTRADVEEHLEIDSQTSDRLATLLLDGGTPLFAGGHSEPSAWDMEIDPRVVAFEDVKDIDDLLAVLAGQRLRRPAERGLSPLDRLRRGLGRYGVVGWASIVSAMAAVVGVAIVLMPGSERPPPPTLAQLEERAGRALPLRLTPPPSLTSSTLGFGDADGGRKVYPYTGTSPASTKPGINSFVDVPGGPAAGGGDERKFLSVKANSVGRGRLEGGWGRAVAIPYDKQVLVYVYVNNSAPPQPNCGRFTEWAWIATDVRLRVSIWRSESGRDHVIRAWITGSNTKPRWVTDAVAVRTDEDTTLRLDPRISWQHSQKPRGFHNSPPLRNKNVLKPAGMLIGNGSIGGCWENRFFVGLNFVQI